MQVILGILVGLLVLMFLVLIHELGHAWAALKSKVVVEEFAIGFPPTAWSKKLKNGILLKLNVLPLGGYVKLQGEYDNATGKGDYGNATFWQKTKILFAGVAMNFGFACLLMTILAWIGLPRVIDNQFRLENDGRVEASQVTIVGLKEDSPATKAGLQKGDAVLKIADTEVVSEDQMRLLTKQYAGQTVEFKYARAGTETSVQVTLNSNDVAKTQGYLGAVPGQSSKIYATWSAPIVGVGTVLQFTQVTLQGVGDLFVNFFGGLIQKLSFDAATQQTADQKLAAAGNSVAGPVGLLGVIFPALLGLSLTDFLFFVALISLTLAVMNALPIPALDGGRWLVTAVFCLLKKPLDEELESKIHGTGMVFLLGLTLIITVSDVFKFF